PPLQVTKRWKEFKSWNTEIRIFYLTLLITHYSFLYSKLIEVMDNMLIHGLTTLLFCKSAEERVNFIFNILLFKIIDHCDDALFFFFKIFFVASHHKRRIGGQIAFE